MPDEGRERTDASADTRDSHPVLREETDGEGEERRGERAHDESEPRRESTREADFDVAALVREESDGERHDEQADEATDEPNEWNGSPGDDRDDREHESQEERSDGEEPGESTAYRLRTRRRGWGLLTPRLRSGLVFLLVGESVHLGEQVVDRLFSLV